MTQRSAIAPLLLFVGGCAWMGVVGSRYIKSVDLVPGQDNLIEVVTDEDTVMAGARLEVPAGAVAGRAHVTLARGEVDLAPDGLGPVAVWQPASLGFSAPVRVAVPVRLHDGLTPADVTVDILTADGAVLTLTPLEVTETRATVEVSALGTFQARVGRCRHSAQCGHQRACLAERCVPGDGGAADAGPADAGAAPDGGAVASGVRTLDGQARGALALAIAVDATGERIGVAYYSLTGTESLPGVPDMSLEYLEFQARTGQVGARQRLAVVQRAFGLALAFDPASGEPVVAYLGGDGGAPDDAGALAWPQNDAVFSARADGATWTDRLVAQTSGEVSCGNVMSDVGFLVGLWPALVFDAQGALVFAYRDGHRGEFPIQDWSSSDVEVWQGSPTGTFVGSCAKAGGVDLKAWGGHLQAAMGATQPGLVGDQLALSAGGGGRNVFFQRRLADGSWTSPVQVLAVGDTQAGPAIAFDDLEGWGIAVVDRSTETLSYLRSGDDGISWSAPEVIADGGSGGWYPSLAMDPVRHEPAVAYAVCSPRPGVSEDACVRGEAALVVAQRRDAGWVRTTVDEGGAYSPRLGFFASGRRFVVYRVPPILDPLTGGPVADVGAVRVAVEP